MFPMTMAISQGTRVHITPLKTKAKWLHVSYYPLDSANPRLWDANHDNSLGDFAGANAGIQKIQHGACVWSPSVGKSTLITKEIYGKSPCLPGKTHHKWPFNSYVSHYQRVPSRYLGEFLSLGVYPKKIAACKSVDPDFVLKRCGVSQ